MLINAYVRSWQKCTGADNFGQPTRTEQDGQWRGQVQSKRRKVILAGRELVSTTQVLVFDGPEFGAGDRVTIHTWGGGEDLVYEILAVDTGPHPVLGYQLLALGLPDSVPAPVPPPAPPPEDPPPEA
jgi:hypothetical protein